MRVGACQTPEVLGDVDRAVAIVRGFAERTGADLLLFPECFLQGYLVTEEHVRAQALTLDGPRFGGVLARLADVGPALVLGLIERDGGHYFNTAVVVRGGRTLGRYRKTFLTAGESVFTAGDDCPVFEHGGVRFGINICYDLQFPQAAAAVAAGGARVLLAPCQNMMPREKAYVWQPRHNEIRGRRARETGLWIVSSDVTGERAARTGPGPAAAQGPADRIGLPPAAAQGPADRIGLGPTAVLDPAGVVVAEVPAGTAGMVTADFAPEPRSPDS